MDNQSFNDKDDQGSSFEDDFVVESLNENQIGFQLSTDNTSNNAVSTKGKRNKKKPAKTTTQLQSKKESHISSISGHQGNNLPPESVEEETDIDVGLRQSVIHKVGQKTSANYAKLHSIQERKETVKCVAAIVIFVALIVILLVYMFVVNPLV